MRAHRVALAVGTALAAVVAAWSSPSTGQALMSAGGGDVWAPVVSMRDMPFRTVVRQRYDFSCGSAALATLLRDHYGVHTDEGTIFRAMYDSGDQKKIQKVGFSLLDMKRYLATLGLSADGYREDIDDLAGVGRPAIALIKVGNYRHFVVVKGVSGGRVLVGDPALGLKAYPLSEFSSMWNGVVFMIQPGRKPATAFNAPTEWALLQPGPYEFLADYSLSALTRELPPIYQVTTAPRVFDIGVVP